jgi:hypothetical protein
MKEALEPDNQTARMDGYSCQERQGERSVRVRTSMEDSTARRFRSQQKAMHLREVLK